MTRPASRSDVPGEPQYWLDGLAGDRREYRDAEVTSDLVLHDGAVAVTIWEAAAGNLRSGVTIIISPAEARHLAARLVQASDQIEMMNGGQPAGATVDQPRGRPGGELVTAEGD